MISGTYTNVESKFTDVLPRVIFDSPSEAVHCEISVNSDLAYYTSRLLAIYSKMDPRVRQLAVVFRHWAKVNIFVRTIIKNVTVEYVELVAGGENKFLSN